MIKGPDTCEPCFGIDTLIFAHLIPLCFSTRDGPGSFLLFYDALKLSVPILNHSHKPAYASLFLTPRSPQPFESFLLRSL